MLIGSSIPLVIGVAMALVLLVIGMIAGFWWGKRSADNDGTRISRNDRDRLMDMLRDIGQWASEYSGNVSDNQDKLAQINDAVLAGASGDSSAAELRVVSLLSQMMETNGELKTRLDEAERQLEKQTRQIASYLTEARTDSLTGLFNRRAFDSRLEEAFAGFRSGGRSFALALIDVDKFKSINDNHGHPAGDQVLKQLARSLKSGAGSAIMVARFGGEEFAVIMDGPLRAAAESMNELRRRIAENPMDAGDVRLNVTVSIGLSEPRDELSVAPVLRRADEALYAAKNIGRNRVYFHDGRAPTLVGAPEVAKRDEASL